MRQFGLFPTTSHLIDKIDTLNEQPISNHTNLVSLDLVNMYPSIGNEREKQAVLGLLNTCAMKKPSTDCLIERLKLCLYMINSDFENENLIQRNGTATGETIFGLYANIAVACLDQTITEQIETACPIIFYFDLYIDGFLVLWDSTDEKIQEICNFISTLNPNLNILWELGIT